MLISEVIDQLKDILKDKGDLEVVCLNELNDEFMIDFDRFFEPIAFPCDEHEDEEHEVCAFLPADIEENPIKPDLKVVKNDKQD